MIKMVAHSRIQHNELCHPMSGYAEVNSSVFSGTLSMRKMVLFIVLSNLILLLLLSVFALVYFYSLLALSLSSLWSTCFGFMFLM